MRHTQRIVLNPTDKENGWVDVETVARIKQGRAISIRLHPKYSNEAQGLRVLATLEAKGHSTREIIADALCRYGGHSPQPVNAQVTVDTHAFAREIEQMRAEFNQQIETLSATIIAMFETMQKTGMMMDIDTPQQPVENREFATNIANAFKNRYGT